MNFVCDHCKQKYHVADEKLRGRAVTRFKCKKCEHIIELQTGSLGGGPGSEHSSPGLSVDPTPQGTQAPPPTAAPAPPAASAKVAPRPRTPTTTGPALSSVSPLTRGPAGAAPAGAAPKARPRAPTTTGPAFSPSSARGATGPSLVGATARAADKAPARKDAPAAPSTSSILNASETGWYAGIRDLPVGPLTRSELSARVQGGDVTADTLVWREGLDDWRPMRSVAELGDLLRLAAQRMSGNLLDELGKRPAGGDKPRGAQVVPIGSARAGSVRPPHGPEGEDDEATKVTGLDPRIAAAVRDADAARAKVPSDAFDIETRPISAFGEPAKTPSRRPPPPAPVHGSPQGTTPHHTAPQATTPPHTAGRAASAPGAGSAPARVVPQTLAATPGSLGIAPTRASVPPTPPAPPATPMAQGQAPASAPRESPSPFGEVPPVGPLSAPEPVASFPPPPASASFPSGMESQPMPLVVPSGAPLASNPSGWSLAPPGNPTVSLAPAPPQPGLPKSVLVLLAGVLVVGLAGGIVIGPRLNAPRTAPTVNPPVATAPSPVVTPPIALPPSPGPEAPTPPPSSVAAQGTPTTPEQGPNGTNNDHGHNRDHRPGGREPTAPQVSAADLALIRAAGGTPTPSGVDGPRDTALRTAPRAPSGANPGAPSSGAGRASSLARSLEQSRVVSRCWQNLLRLNPAAGARPVRITVSLSVNGAGRVSSVSVSNAPSPQFASCVESGARTLPPLGAGEALTTEVPVNLSAGTGN
ncbi:MAG: zinc-ribbon domain-containing protein [Deltaproteobacteria bacterium]|nr:zinc-ribbon domain-containing protein [Deltaproteobacteria bacterium]